MAPRRKSRRIHVGSVAVGGGAPVSVQTMTKTDTRDVRATVAQILSLERAGCDIIRLAVPDEEAARALRPIRRSIHIPLIADIHFNYRLALLALSAGADGLRINPGNIGSRANVAEIVRAARERKIPIRIGVNAGSLESAILAKYGGATAKALVASAVKHARILEDLDYREIKISVKASDAARTVQAYRLLAQETDYPLHLGVTEAGTLLTGTVRSCTAVGILLAEGIGDTLRISLTEPPEREVKVGLEILRALELRPPGASVIACPTCGRIELNVMALAHQVEEALAQLARNYPRETLASAGQARGKPTAAWPVVAVMGCMVNGPGEAREADIAIAGGKGKAALYVDGIYQATVKEGRIVPALLRLVRAYLKRSDRPCLPRRRA
ncbi:MAG: flavodoxin-dependent (E)-4-hydroxy-3-methylbut-2-enyl-diphosphate synthase [Lentisphaerae bacterium]|nr:flavodoxin-dependent (E)-4-hydroxy-3-methylbut-2-enyl-diphosphate synthase [Lentisphaerota bacterium]